MNGHDLMNLKKLQGGVAGFFTVLLYSKFGSGIVGSETASGGKGHKSIVRGFIR